jgi:hypothetical protein
LALIPATASVVAQAAIVPHLSEREHVFMLAGAEHASSRETPDFVIAAPDVLSPWPLADAAAVRAVLERYLALGYTRRLDDDGWVVLAK